MDEKQKKEAIFRKRCFDQMDISFSITGVLKTSAGRQAILGECFWKKKNKKRVELR
jgi:hypothetical protein